MVRGLLRTAALAALAAGARVASAPVCGIADIWILEVHPDGPNEDYIELQNVSTEPCSLEGWVLGDKKTHPRGTDYDPAKAADALTFGDVVLNPNEIWYGEEGGENSFNFGVSKSGEEIILASPDGQVNIVVLDPYEYTNEEGVVVGLEGQSWQPCPEPPAYCYKIELPNKPAPDLSGCLLFSSYAEGSSNNKYIEIFNTCDTEVSLANFAFPSVSNEPTTPGEHEFWNTFPEGAVIPAEGFYTICHPDKSEGITSCDHDFLYLSNGDDGFALVYGVETDFVVIDAIGDWSAKPSGGWAVCGISQATKDRSLVRKCEVKQGNRGQWDASAGTTAENCEWLVLEKDSFCLQKAYCNFNEEVFAGCNALLDVPVCASTAIILAEANPAGQPEDYVKLRNVGDVECSLQGWILADAKTHPQGGNYDPSKDDERLVFDDVRLEPGQDWFGEEGIGHSFNFGLSKGGETIVLESPTNDVQVYDIPPYEEEVDGIVVGKKGMSWQLTTECAASPELVLNGQADCYDWRPESPVCQCTPGSTDIVHLQSCHNVTRLDECRFESACTNIEVIVQGVVTAVAEYGFFIQHSGVEHYAGIYCYVADSAKRIGLANGGLLPARIGQVVEVTGTVKEYYGVSEILVSGISQAGTDGELPGYVPVNAADLNNCIEIAEKLEGMLVRVNDIEVADFIYNHDVVIATDASGETFEIGTLPGLASILAVFPDLGVNDTLGYIQGVLHYAWGNYRVLPVVIGDVGPLTMRSDETRESEQATIQQITSHSNPVDYDCATFDSPYLEKFVFVEGVVTYVGRYAFFIQQGQGPGSGVRVFVSAAFRSPLSEGGHFPTVGQYVLVEGLVSEYYYSTQINSLKLVQALQRTVVMPDPLTLDAAIFDHANCTIEAEQYEGVLVRLENVEITSEADQYSQVFVSDGTGTMHIHGYYVEDANGNYEQMTVFDENSELQVGDTLQYVVGVLDYAHSEWELRPRGPDDFGPIGVLEPEEPEDTEPATFEGEVVEVYGHLTVFVGREVVPITKRALVELSPEEEAFQAAFISMAVTVAGVEAEDVVITGLRKDSMLDTIDFDYIVSFTQADSSLQLTAGEFVAILEDADALTAQLRQQPTVSSRQFVAVATAQGREGNSSKALDAGTIAGIAVGTALAAGGLVGLVMYLGLKKKAERKAFSARMEMNEMMHAPKGIEGGDMGKTAYV
eukprot:scaffold1809_cov386-Prasinococcus_capsulatus_cf.AAC.25